MNSDLLNVIKNAKQGDSNALYDLILKFNPLLTKYSNYLNYEDAKSDLILRFIEIIYKLPIKKTLIDDKFILSYINKAVINSYINIKHTTNKINNTEHVCEIEDWNNKLDFHSDLEFYDLLKGLTDKEKQIITLKYLNCLSDNEISKKLKISRQYVNRLNRQGLFKIKKFIL